MKITKKETYGTIDYNEEDREILYCAYCARFNVRAILEYRQNYEASDKELWRECPNCKRIVPASSGRGASKLKGVVDPLDTPFDKASIAGLDNKRPRNAREKRRQELLKKANKELDSEIRKEILKGNEVDEGPKH